MCVRFVLIAGVVAVLLVVVDDVLPRGGGADGPLRPAAVVRDALPAAVLGRGEPGAARVVAGKGGAPVGIPAHAGLLPVLLLVAVLAQGIQVVGRSKCLKDAD